MKKKLLIFAATVASLICILCLTASAAEIASGTCGKNLTWSLDDKGLLTISGTGVMDNWTMTSKVPWNKNKTAIKEAVIENGVTSIGYNAFQGCSSLTKVTLPESLTTINNSAFYKCTSLEAITLPSKLENINGSAFYGCSSIKSINIPASLSTLGSNALANCFALESITVDAENAKYSSFEGVLFNKDMSELVLYPPAKTGTTYTIPSGVKKISAYAISDCAKLESVILSNSVTAISGYAFEASTSIKSIYIPTNVIYIGNLAFSSCSNLRTITYAGTQNGWNMITKGSTWDKNAGSYNLVYENRYFIIESGKCGDSLSWSVDSERTLTISGTGAMYDYEAGSAPWYTHKEYVGALVLSDGVTSIGSYAFYKHSALNLITFSKSLTAIGNSAFEYCALLTSVAIPGTVTTIGDWAYTNCQSLVSITIPASVTSIGYGAFSAIWPLESITVDANNKNYSSIDGILFNKDKTTLILYPMNKAGTTYDIPTGVTCIADRAFYNCKLLNEISIPAGVTDIGSYTFAYCKALTSITVPAGVTSIGVQTFSNCDSLKNVSLPNTISLLGDRAFASCALLGEIDFGGTAFEWFMIPKPSNWNYGAAAGTPEVSCKDDDSILAFGKCGDSVYWYLGADGTLNIEGSGVMYDYCSSVPSWYTSKDKITSAVIFDGITSIGECAFMDCSALVSISISQSVTLIGDGAFFGCTALSKITIPSDMQIIGDHAFYGCSALSTITYPKTKTEWSKIEKGTSWDQSAGAATANGKYTLVCEDTSDMIWGDVTGDGVIDSKDLVRLKKYIAAYDHDTGTSSVEISDHADATGDSVVDSKDLVRLKKYIAAYDYDTGTSDVVLGPEKFEDPDGEGWSDFFPC